MAAVPLRVSQGALYTLGGVTKPAEAFALQHGIEIADGASLAARAKARLSEKALSDLLNPLDRRCPKCEAPMVWRTETWRIDKSPFISFLRSHDSRRTAG